MICRHKCVTCKHMQCFMVLIICLMYQCNGFLKACFSSHVDTRLLKHGVFVKRDFSVLSYRRDFGSLRISIIQKRKSIIFLSFFVRHMTCPLYAIAFLALPKLVHLGQSDVLEMYSDNRDRCQSQHSCDPSMLLLST